jgi:hypothetical protein
VDCLSTQSLTVKMFFLVSAPVVVWPRSPQKSGFSVGLGRDPGIFVSYSLSENADLAKQESRGGITDLRTLLYSISPTPSFLKKKTKLRQGLAVWPRLS